MQLDILTPEEKVFSGEVDHVQLPGMDGYEATKQIREFNARVVIIAQTAFALQGDKKKALDAGCNDYISKPITKDELLKMIRKYFGK